METELAKSLGDVFLERYAYIFLLGGFASGVFVFFNKVKGIFFIALCLGSSFALLFSFIAMNILGTNDFVWIIASLVGGSFGFFVYLVTKKEQ